MSSLICWCCLVESDPGRDPPFVHLTFGWLCGVYSFHDFLQRPDGRRHPRRFHVAGASAPRATATSAWWSILWHCQIMVLQFMGPTGWIHVPRDGCPADYAVDKGACVFGLTVGARIRFSTHALHRDATRNPSAMSMWQPPATADCTDLVLPLPASFQPRRHRLRIGSMRSNETPARRLEHAVFSACRSTHAGRRHHEARRPEAATAP